MGSSCQFVGLSHLFIFPAKKHRETCSHGLSQLFTSDPFNQPVPMCQAGMKVWMLTGDKTASWLHQGVSHNSRLKELDSLIMLDSSIKSKVPLRGISQIFAFHTCQSTRSRRSLRSRQCAGNGHQHRCGHRAVGCRARGAGETHVPWSRHRNR